MIFLQRTSIEESIKEICCNTEYILIPLFFIKQLVFAVRLIKPLLQIHLQRISCIWPLINFATVSGQIKKYVTK